MAWVSPTGHNDPSSKWTTEANAYDENTNTYANCGRSGYYLELIHDAINCDKIKIRCADWKTTIYDVDIDIDVYYSSNWHNIWSGVVTKITWIEKEIGSTESITAARTKCNSLGGGHLFRLYEFDFNEVETNLINGYFMQDGSKEEKFGYYMNSMEEFGYYMNSLV